MDFTSKQNRGYGFLLANCAFVYYAQHHEDSQCLKQNMNKGLDSFYDYSIRFWNLGGACGKLSDHAN